MPDVQATINTILRAYVRDPSSPIESLAPLNDLGIDQLDLQMISLDIEDGFGVQILFDEEIEDMATVHSLVGTVEALIDMKAKLPPARPRIKSNWLSTGAERRR